MTSWTDIKSRWSSTWTSLHERAKASYDAAIRTNPSAYRDRVVAFVSLLTESRANLDRIKAHLATVDDPELQAKAQELESRYATLAAGVYADAKPADTVGVAPLVVGGVVVAGVLISVAGIAWAVAAYQYAVNLREHTGLLEKELAARVEASRSGRALPPSSIPPQPNPVEEARSMGVWLLGGLTLAAAAVAVPILMKRAG